MFRYPAQAALNRVVFKTKIYANAKPAKRVKGLFVAQVEEIVWQYKLAPDTVNLPPRGGYSEIQVFAITLKETELDQEVLRTIDRAIPYPIIFHQHHNGQVKLTAAYKRPSADGGDNWVVGPYFATPWQDQAATPKPLPAALDLKALYEQMLLACIELPPRPGETLPELITRLEALRRCHRELHILEARLHKEKQFNRKVELNAQARTMRKQLLELQK